MSSVAFRHVRLQSRSVPMVPTRDHAIIRKWAAQHDAMPAQIHPLKFDGQPAILYFLLRGTGRIEGIEPISWGSFFAQFDLLELSFAFDENSPRFDILKVNRSPEASLQH